MQSSSEVIMERPKPVSSELVVSASATVDITPGTHSELLQSTAISMSLKTAASPSPVDCDLEEADNPNAGLEQALQSFVSKEIQERIQKILEEVQQLSDTEKLLLYLRLPGESAAADSKDDFDQNQSLPISTTRAEQTQAFHWIRCHLEECDNNSTLPKHEVYDEYKAHCESMNAARTLSAPDFGKIIKCVFPRVKARRLGTRGNSKYCYSGIQRKKNVKPPTLPSLQVPSASEKEKSSTNAANSLNGGDKIEEDQTLSAACLLVCEWANKLLGRVFSTLIELARFLVGGSYVSSKSMAAFVVMSSNDLSTPQISQSLVSLMSPLKQVEEQMLLTQKRRQSQQLPKKMPQRQQTKQIQQISANSIIQQGTGLCAAPPQLLGHKALVSISSPQKPVHKQPLHIQPKPIQPTLQSPPGQIGQFYQQQPPGNPSTSPSTYPPKIRPITPSMISPTTPIQPAVPQTPSPFQSSPKFNTPGTPQNRPVTPSSASATPRHTPNSAEPTRFLFTPIPNGSQEQRVSRGETSPPTLRPTATHPGQLINGDWSQQGAQPMGISEVPMSPSKQPRLINQNPPSTPTSNRRPGSFAYPLPSPRTPQRITPQQYVTSPTMASPGVVRQLNPMSPNVARGQEFMVPMITSVESIASAGFSQGVNMSTTSSSASDVHISQQHSKQGTPVLLPKSCRYSSGSETGHMQQSSVIQHQTMDYSPELESICNQATSSASQMPPPSYQRSQSVPPLTQHALADQRFHPLTPQTTTRTQHLTPSPMDTSNQHLNGLKELRNRVLHGDVNNNGSRPPPDSAFSARRNLTPMLNAEHSNMNASNWEVSQVRTNHQNRAGEDHEMTILENNLTFADLGNENDETLSDLNTLDDATTEAVLRNICNNTSGVWPTNDVPAWPTATSQALQIMD